jgi:hypothetical protein
MAQEAGWGTLSYNLSTEAGILSVLEIPEGTRSAGSVLAGTEAWPGEKASVLDRITQYAIATYQKEGVVDTGVTLDTVGVTPGLEDRQVFAVPPHTLESDSARIIAWHDGLVGDLEATLASDPHADELIQNFRTDLEGIIGS